jgi:hypothetical protein
LQCWGWWTVISWFHSADVAAMDELEEIEAVDAAELDAGEVCGGKVVVSV